MVQSNEFSGVNLQDAVRKATAAYGGCCEIKNYRRCNDLIRRIASLSSLSGDYANRSWHLEREITKLRGELRETLGSAAIAALGGFVGALLKFRRALKAIERLTRNEKLSLEDLRGLAEAAGAVGAAALTVIAVFKHYEILRLAHEAEELARNGERLANRLDALNEEYDRLECGESRRSPGV